ncbi:MAG: hypothetical protein IK088_06070 [Lachnospiraceae bacterium]|nr:hypothetical protein [Lachnospiraceae bacterium]
MKKVSFIVLCVILVLAGASACSGQGTPKAPEPKYGFVTPVEGDELASKDALTEKGREIEKLALEAGISLKTVSYEQDKKSGDEYLIIHIDYIDASVDRFYVRDMKSRGVLQIGLRGEDKGPREKYIDVISRLYGFDEGTTARIKNLTNRDSMYAKANGKEYYVYCSFVMPEGSRQYMSITINP